ncbi:MAG TPA: hypothetical protein VJ899_05370 [Salegentibacter sp.]|nr:hypothetical protein [Salegentibacter sp.]
MRVEGKKILVITMLLFTPLMLVAQEVHPPPPDNIVMGTPPPPPGLPIDFGISALIAAGLGLGIHHIRNRK